MLTPSSSCTTFCTTVASLCRTASTTKAAACYYKEEWQDTRRRELWTLPVTTIQLTLFRRTTQKVVKMLPVSETERTNLRDAWNV